MHSDLVLLHVLVLKDIGIRNYTGADDEEGGLEIVLAQVLQKICGRTGTVSRTSAVLRTRTIIVSETPGELVRTGSDILWGDTTTTCPPTDASICGSCRVCRTATKNSGSDIRDYNTRVGDLLNPLLHLR